MIASIRFVCVVAVIVGQATIGVVDISTGHHRNGVVAVLCAVVNGLLFW